MDLHLVSFSDTICQMKITIVLSECGFLVLYCLFWATKALWVSSFLREDCQARGCPIINEVGGLKLYCFQFYLLHYFFLFQIFLESVIDLEY